MILPETFWLAKHDRLADQYLVAGDRAYLVGTQDGAFPDLGWHVEGEMGGIWTAPLKLFDGFWLQVDGAWLVAADVFEAGPFSSRQRYTAGEDLRVTRHQFVPDGEPAVVVRFSFLSPVSRDLEVRFLARSDLQLVWSPRRDGGARTPDTARYVPALGAWLCTGSVEGQAAVVGGARGRPLRHQAGPELWGPERTRGQGISVALEYRLSLEADRETSLDFVLAGSTERPEAAEATFRRVSGAVESLWQAKGARLERLGKHSALEIPEPSVARAWDWLKHDLDWLVCDVPGLGRGLCAGAPDYMWWFGCDSAYAALGCLALGRHEAAISTLDLVRDRSLEGNGECGRVLHELTTAGEIADAGRVQETPHFTEAVWTVFCWTGDLGFLERSYEFCKRGLLDWTIGERCRDGELLPHGYGIVEIEGLDLQCIDTAAHTVRALDALAGMADVVGDGATALRCRRLAVDARKQLEAAFWLEDEGVYADMLATPEELGPRVRRWISAVEAREFAHGRQSSLLDALTGLLDRVETDPEQRRKRGWLVGNWMIVAPLEAGLAPRDRALRALSRLNGPEFVGRRGMYLSGWDHTHTMSVNTGALAVANLHYGLVDEALSGVRTMTDTLLMQMPGAISEMLPDYGCCVQAWSSYAVAWPVVAGVFGVQPEAHRRVLRLSPRFPPSWPAVRLRNLRIGGAAADLTWNGECLTVSVGEPGWQVEGSVPGGRLEVARERGH